MKSAKASIAMFSLTTALGQVAQIGFLLITLRFGKNSGPELFGGIGLALGIYNLFFVFGTGVLSSQDFFVSWSLGAGKPKEGLNWFFQSLYLSLLVSGVLFLGIQCLNLILLKWVPNSETSRFTAQLLGILSWSLPVQLLFQSIRQYFQSNGKPGLPTLALWIGNMVHLFAGEILLPVDNPQVLNADDFIFRIGGLVALNRVLLLILMLAIAYKHIIPVVKRLTVPHLSHLYQLLKLGVPSALNGGHIVYPLCFT